MHSVITERVLSGISSRKYHKVFIPQDNFAKHFLPQFWNVNFGAETPENTFQNMKPSMVILLII